MEQSCPFLDIKCVIDHSFSSGFNYWTKVCPCRLIVNLAGARGFAFKFYYFRLEDQVPETHLTAADRQVHQLGVCAAATETCWCIALLE
jgi:hypothetical protein